MDAWYIRMLSEPLSVAGRTLCLLTMPDRGRTHALQSARVNTVISLRANPFQRLLGAADRI